MRVGVCDPIDHTLLDSENFWQLRLGFSVEALRSLGLQIKELMVQSIEFELVVKPGFGNFLDPLSMTSPLSVLVMIVSHIICLPFLLCCRCLSQNVCQDSRCHLP